ncbi:MAG TPA: DUF2911 domain-containing protein [Chitinophagaceae bacterium]|nr:DUF2911 domain-containing protein [Chitinophagaceae bacterium]
MKQLICCIALLIATQGFSQPDKSKRPSPPALVKQTLASGATVSIDYSQPSVKGRTIGVDLEPMPAKVWRTGANEATVFETDKDVKVEGKLLPAGKYALFSIVDGETWTFIFNKTWKQWGAFGYKDAEDALRIQVAGTKAVDFSEQLNFQISEVGLVTLNWGDRQVSFRVE